MEKINPKDIYPWNLLSSDAKYIIDDVYSKWIEMLDDTNNEESVYQKFLAEHAGLFFSDGQKTIPVISELRLGTEYRVDFVIVKDERSYGFKYEFVEIETPHTRLYTSRRDPKARFTHSIQQVKNWQRWLEDNPSEAKKLFPSFLYSVSGISNFGYKIYIGRRSSNEEFLALRNYHAKDIGIQIHSLDQLTDFLGNRYFYTFCKLCSTEMDTVDIYTKNRLANPFFRSYSEKEWKKIIKSHNFELGHMVANNANILLENRRYNNLFLKFKSFWNNFPLNRKLEIIKRMEALSLSK